MTHGSTRNPGPLNHPPTCLGRKNIDNSRLAGRVDPIYGKVCGRNDLAAGEARGPRKEESDSP